MMAIDLLLSVGHAKYNSEFSLAVSAVKYSIVRSPTIMRFDSHQTNSGQFKKFINWYNDQAALAEELPEEGFLHLVFDNDQKHLKDYLIRGDNKQTYSVVTSIIGMLPRNSDDFIRIAQNTIASPWRDREPSLTEIKQSLDSLGKAMTRATKMTRAAPEKQLFLFEWPYRPKTEPITDIKVLCSIFGRLLKHQTT